MRTHTHIYKYKFLRAHTCIHVQIYITHPNLVQALTHTQCALPYSIKSKVWQCCVVIVVVVGFIHVYHSWILASTFFNAIRHIVIIFQKRPRLTHPHTHSHAPRQTMTNDQLLLLFLF